MKTTRTVEQLLKGVEQVSIFAAWEGTVLQTFGLAVHNLANLTHMVIIVIHCMLVKRISRACLVCPYISYLELFIFNTTEDIKTA